MIFGIPSFYVYYTFLAICCGYAIYRGGRPEYIGVTIMIVGSVVTKLTSILTGEIWGDLHEYILIIDLIALLAFIHLALSSDRFWPMWATAFHLLAISIHGATIVVSQVNPWAIATAANFWAYPMILSVAIGAHECVRSKDKLIAGRG